MSRLLLELMQIKRLKRLPLALEIAIALLLKIVLLFFVWKAFFSVPQTKKMMLPTAQVEQHLLAASSQITNSSHSQLSKEFHDSAR